MTTEDLTQRNLAKLDAMYSALREMVADPQHLNKKSRSMTETIAALNTAIDNCFAAKNVIAEASRP